LKPQLILKKWREGQRKKLIVLLDEGTPILSAGPFLKRGYQVIYHGDVLDSGAKDDLVAATAILNEAALIAVDLDMKRLVRRFGAQDNGRFKKLDLIFVGCDPVMAAKRLAHAMSFIENEWNVRCEKAAHRLWVSIDSHRLTTYR
jgi:predicted nuclease of predicted toxin-antitoxin system